MQSVRVPPSPLGTGTDVVVLAASHAQGSGTYTGAGLSTFRTGAMNESEGFRPDAKTVIIVVTGGDAEDIDLAVSETAAIVATGVSGPGSGHQVNLVSPRAWET